METTPQGLARLIPGVAPAGYSEDNGGLLVGHILWGLPADVFPTVFAASRGLNRLANDSIARGPPLIGYADALAAGHVPALHWYWTSPAAEAYLSLGYPRTLHEGRTEPGYEWYEDMHGNHLANIIARETITVATILAGHGHIEALQLARTLGCPWDARVYARAAAHNHIGLMTWAHANGCPLEASREEEEHGLISDIIWHALAHRRPLQDLSNIWDNDIYDEAAANGHIEGIQWARTHRLLWSARPCAAAAQNGHLEVLQWLRAQDPPFPWSSTTCAFAASGGHLAVLRWAHENGAPLREQSIWHNACAHVEVLQWVHDLGVPWDPDRQNIYHYAARAGRLDIIQWLRAQDPPCPWGRHPTKITRVAAAYNHTAIVQWLRENGCP